MLAVVCAAACRPAPPPPAVVAAASQIVPKYDSVTGSLTQLEADLDRDGLIETWAYMDGARVVRVEVDENGDRVVDLWEYHQKPAGQEGRDGQDSKGGQRGNVARVPRPVKLQRGGLESPDKTVERIERATRRDGVVSRWEYFDDGMLTRVEEDKDGDGKIDKWETYNDGSLAMMAIDTTHRGKADRRLVYRPDGTLDRIEIDPNGTGTFQLQSAAK